MPFARVNGTMLYYREAGEGDLAVFIHGFPLDHSVWLNQLQGLAHVRHCIAPDLRGHGRSDPIVEASLTMEVIADDIAGLIEALGATQADIIGLSMGGYAALALYELRPAMVRSLALVDTRATPDSGEARAARDVLAEQLLDGGRVAFAGQMIPTLLGPRPTRSIRARVRSMIEDTRYETMVAALEGMKDRPDRSALLPHIAVPTLVIAGEHDVLAPPAQARAMAESIPGARTTVIRGAGHLSPLERPDEVNSALIELLEGRKVVWWRDEEKR
ncbi:MAG: alpha/beta hydrolase [Actinobacteria bacterium]|nr:alpha/beta hydrolase [Actinomycetota bacterium]